MDNGLFYLTVTVAGIGMYLLVNEVLERRGIRRRKAVESAIASKWQFPIAWALETSAINRRHREPKDAVAAAVWAQHRLINSDSYYILDCETTGLAQYDEAIELAVLDMEGQVIFNERFKPSRISEVPSAATKVHGITSEDLIDCQPFSAFAAQLAALLQSRTILIYNAEFDCRLIRQTYHAAQLDCPPFHAECVMIQYAAYAGVYNARTGDYRYQPLPAAAHTAASDCAATLALLHEMAYGR